MRLGWRIPLPGPFYLGGTIWQSQYRRRPYYHGRIGKWECPHHHERPDTARACAQREIYRREHGLIRRNAAGGIADFDPIPFPAFPGDPYPDGAWP